MSRLVLVAFMALAAGSAATAVSSLGSGGLAVARAASKAGAPPLIGVTYTHTSLAGCSLDRTGIVLHYDTPGVRRLVKTQLAAMRAAGIQTIRILLWNMSDISGQDWGVLPSAGGTLVEPYRSNLIRFASDVRAAGFTRFTVEFSPQWTNNPVGEYGPTGLTADRWDPSKLDENWNFIASVHKLVKTYGPDDTRFDFISEGPPSRYQPDFIVARMENYIATFWTRYVNAFGKEDVTVTTIGKGSPDGLADRLQHLIDALRGTGLGYPAWFGIHPDWTSPAVLNELRAADATLNANGLTTQALTVGESSYENSTVAADIASFIGSSSRHVDEVYEWWQTSEGGACQSAPYRADAYITALTGAAQPPPTASPLPLLPIPKLTATLSKRGIATLREASNRPVVALDAGTYRITLHDESSTAGFRLVGAGIDERTGKRFVGQRVLSLDIGTGVVYGSSYRYGSTDKPRQHAFVIH